MLKPTEAVFWSILVAFNLLIVQVSDIHVGPEFQEQIFQQAVDEINNLNVDVLLVTGDLTENGLLSEFERASMVMKRFRCRSRIYTSGNHDYRNTGYLLFKHFSQSTQYAFPSDCNNSHPFLSVSFRCHTPATICLCACIKPVSTPIYTCN
jgi:predicted MPP superfamily phosphohydrolase